MALMMTSTRYPWVVLGLVFVAQFSGALSTFVVAALAPLLQEEFGLSKAGIGIFSSAIFMGWTVVLLAAGSVTDRLGVRKVMAVGQIATGLLLLAMAAVTTYFQALAVMFIAGLAGGTLGPGVTKAIREWFPRRIRATAMGIKQAAVPVGGVVAASLLPAFALVAGWRLAVAAVGLAILASGVATGVLYRDARAEQDVAEGEVGIRAAVGKVVRNRGLWSVTLVTVLLVTGQMGVVTYLALYFNEIMLVPLVPDGHTRVVVAGGFLAVCQAGGAFGRVFWGVVSDRVFRGGRMSVLATVGVLTALASLVVARLEPGVPMQLMVVLVFLYGTTAIGWNAVSHVAMSEAVGRKYAGTGVGLGLTVNQLGNIGGPPLFGLVVDLSGSYQAAWLAVSFVTAVGSLLALLNARREKRFA